MNGVKTWFSLVFSLVLGIFLSCSVQPVENLDMGAGVGKAMKPKALTTPKVPVSGNPVNPYTSIFSKIVRMPGGADGSVMVAEVDMSKKLEEKLNVKVNPYRILGFCNPKFAYEAILENNDIGVFLPCTIVVKKLDNSMVEVVTANPALFMEMLNNDKLNSMADEVENILKLVFEKLK